MQKTTFLLLVPFSLAAVPACSRSSSSSTERGQPSAEPSQASAAPVSPSAAAPSASASASATATGGAIVTLLDAGQPPRRKLRYAWHVDRGEQLALDLRTTATTEVAGARQPEVQLPPVHIDVAIDPQSVSPEGDLRYAWHVTSASVTQGAQSASQLVEGMRAEVAAVQHLSGKATVTSRGLATDVTIDPTSIVDAGTTGQMVDQVRQTLRDVAAPLPEEEVGRGGRWQRVSQLEAKDTHVAQQDTFTLTTLEGDRGSLDDVLAQTAPPQALGASGLPPESRARLESMLASGDAKTQFDLSRLVPRTKFDGTTTMVVSGGGDVARRVSMIMRVGIVIQGTTR